MEKKSLDYSPDETVTIEKGKVEIARVGDTSWYSNSLGTFDEQHREQILIHL